MSVRFPVIDKERGLMETAADYIGRIDEIVARELKEAGIPSDLCIVPPNAGVSSRVEGKIGQTAFERYPDHYFITDGDMPVEDFQRVFPDTTAVSVHSKEHGRRFRVIKIYSPENLKAFAQWLKDNAA